MLSAATLLIGVIGIAGLLLFARQQTAESWRNSLLALELRLPLGLSTGDITRWLYTVAAATQRAQYAFTVGQPVALEVTADHAGVRYFLLLPRGLRAAVLSGLRAALPGVRIQDAATYLTDRPRFTAGAETQLDNRHRQMAVDRDDITALAVLATLQPLEETERVVVQVLLVGTRAPEPVPSMTAGRKSELPAWLVGEELTDGDAIRSARQKQADGILQGTLRVAATAPTSRAASAIVDRVLGQYRGQDAPGVRLMRKPWVMSEQAASRLARVAWPLLTWPLRLSTLEAAGLLPFQVGEVALPGVDVGLARQLPPPPGMPATGAQLGVSNYPDMRTPLRLLDEDRLKHLHVLGPTGVGKSTLLDWLALQDVDAGHAVVVIDPKSDLVADLLARIPERYASNVIVLDPASTDQPIGFNLLQSAHDEQSRELVVDHVIHIWHELYKDFWGPRTEDVLRATLLTLINAKGANGEAFTLIEAPELLTNTQFRNFVTEQDTVPPALTSFWAWYRGVPPPERLKIIGPILNKLRASTLRTPIRLMLGQSNGLDLDAVLREKKTLLVPLSAGTLGAETASLLGTVLLAGLWFAIQRRVTLPASERHPVFAHVDEAQMVWRLPVDPHDMLDQGRGLGVGYTVAHQRLGQIEDKQMRSALLDTVRSQLVFQCQRDDAEILAKSYQPHLTAKDLMGLDKFEFAMRAHVGGQTLAPLTGTSLPLPEKIRDGTALAETSRHRYGRPRSEVEAALKERGRSPHADDGKPGDTGKGRPFGRRRRPSGEQGGTA